MTEKNFKSSRNSYSMALYELSLENSSTEIVEEQVQAIMKLLNNSKDFEDLIKNPTIKQTDKKNIFNSLSKQFNFNELLTKFLNFLIQKRRLFYIKKILSDFILICSEQRGEVQAKLITSKNISAQELESIKNELKENFGSNIKLNYVKDQSLIGGLVLQVGSVMIDTSIKNKLKQIEQQMIEA